MTNPNQIKNKKRILVLITHSLGEFDVLFPLFTDVKVKYDVDVKMIITVNRIYRQYKTNDFYRFCAKELNIKVNRCQLPNKFDYRDIKFLQNIIGRYIIKLYYTLLKVINYPIIFPKLFWADSFMHEYSNQRGSTYILYKISKIFQKDIFVYHHGHTLTQVSENPKMVLDSDKVSLLLFHDLSKDWGKSLGYKKFHTIGWPKFYKNWLNMVYKYKTNYLYNDHIVVFSRQAGHPYYMDIEKYESLLLESYESIRHHYKDNLIVIKPHPREDVALIKLIINKYNMYNVIISFYHAVILSMNAKMVISFWTSAIFDSFSIGIPTIEFYKEAYKFREVEPKGSLFKLVGIDSTNNKEGLIKFITKVKNNDYVPPEIIEDFKLINDVSFVTSFS